MKKNKLYVFSSLLIIILLFSVAALCNQCGPVTPVTAETSAAGDKTDVEESKESATEETTDKTEETTNETGETSATDDTSDNSAPTIKLEIYEGPTYHAGDDVCYYRVKAVVTGKPTPTVKFSKDDSGGVWGTKKAQVNIHRGETYTLKATAKNSEGEDTDSITLTWGCNNIPVISDITLSSATIETNKTYDVTANATDADSDSLTYKWTISSGTINNGSSNPMKWTTPNTAGDCTITVLVTDGKGGEATKSKTVSISAPAPVGHSVDIGLENSLSGYIVVELAAYVGVAYTFVGDYTNDRQIKSYLSFNINDISSLDEATITGASLAMPVDAIIGHPELMPNVHVKVFDYGNSLELADQGTGGTIVKIFPTSSTMTSFNFTSPELIAALQNAADSNSQRFQLKISLDGVNVDGIGDWYRFIPSSIKLHIDYETPG